MSKLILENVRGSYVYIVEPRREKEDKDGNTKDGKFGMQVIIPKDSKHAKMIEKAVDEVLSAKFGPDALKKKSRYKLPLRDGDEDKDGEEYEGMYFFNANSKKKPGLVNRKNRPASEDDIEEYCYSGAFFNVSISIYAFDVTDGGKPGVAVGLKNVMLKGKGERLDSSTSAEEDFSKFAEDNDDDDDDF